MSEVPRLLVVDDDDLVLSVLEATFASQGWQVVAMTSVAAALQAAAREPFDLIVLDIMLPDGNGIACCREIRALTDRPIVMLTARQSTAEKVEALDAGADDYVVKPFDPDELSARVRAQLRRAETRRSPAGGPLTVKVGPLFLDRVRKDATLGGAPLGLSQREFEVLFQLGQTPGQAVRKERLLQAIWGEDDDVSDKLLAVTIHRLRQKLESDPMSPARLVTVRGFGYRLNPD